MPTLFRAVRKITPTFFVFILVSCSGNEKNVTAIKAMEEGLINSNRLINISSEVFLRSLHNKTEDWITREKAKKWEPKAAEINRLTSEEYMYLEKMKGKSPIPDKTIDELYHRLISYKEKVLAVDSTIWYTFSDNITVFGKSLDSLIKTEKDFERILSSNTDPSTGSALLVTFQNNIKIVESKTLAYCDQNVSSMDGGFYVYSALVFQNSNYLKNGDDLHVKAGIGAFSKATRPEIKIDGIPVPLEDSGFATLVKKIKKTPGKYSMPIEINFIDLNSGKKEKIIYTVKYTVAKECDQ